MTNRRELYFGDLMMMIATIIWGAMTVFSKQILAELDTFNMIALRFLIAFILCLAVFRKRYRQLSRTTVRHAGIIGSLLFISYLFMVWGCKYTTAGNAGFMMSLSAVFIPLFLCLHRRQTPSPRLVIAVVITILGVGLMCLSRDFSLNKGDLFSMGSAFCYAFQMIYTEKYARKNDPVVLGTLQFIFVSLYGFICCFLLEDSLRLPQSSAGWVQLLYLAVMCGAVGFILQTVAEKRIPSSHASLIYATQPVFVALSAFLILGEPISLRQVIGMVVIFLGVLLIEQKREAAEIGQLEEGTAETTQAELPA